MSKSTQFIKFLDNIAIADVAFEVKGETLSQLFENASIALIQSMADISQVDANESKEIALEANSLDTLLFDYLSEMLILKDSENLLFSQFDVNIRKNSGNWKLSAIVKGEQADPERHKIKIDIKAITMHMFKLEKTDAGYEARVVVDI